jgi:cytochrome c peroxidase
MEKPQPRSVTMIPGLCRSSWFWFTVLMLNTFLMGCTSAPRQEKQDAGAPRIAPPYKLSLPLGLDADAAVIPANNPLTEEKIKLGKKLYFDKRLSIDRSLSCATCHIPEKGFADDEPFSNGVGRKKGNRNAPTVINRLFSTRQFWDGRAASLEDQAIGPVHNPVEMAMPNPKVLEDRLKQDAEYAALFRAAFPPAGLVNEDHIAKAIASFERTVLSGNSPYDRFLAGDKTAMNGSAQRGYAIFMDEKRGNCVTCHVNFNFTDENYYNLGVGMRAKHPDLGRFSVTRLEGHKGAFKTPTLRNVADTAPYLHDGSEKTLEDVINLYEKGGVPNPWLSPKMKPLKLTRQDKQDLVEFLKALSGEVSWYGHGEDVRSSAARREFMQLPEKCVKVLPSLHARNPLGS